ncbi:uncharacterized protein CELE_Y53F4B.17 [Caenorhabditis elegans]|uniref:Uncharacterized protein n=1 Tax=Caenorhabditis elegans TaxID=6239 RepID=Q9NAA2_CAEEL|nr:Uncharacterized protein CELE_Y53F4B.17 [Caenorhabditis elegans]CAB70107.2 Uncharacterized protein CELE_Y53F4B.17 [Caenorhabditis elegans]
MDQSIYSSVSAGLEPRSADVRGEDEDVQEVGHGEQRVREVDPRADREVESDPFSEATTFRSDQVHPLGSWFSVFRSDSSSPAPSTSTNEEVEERSFRAPSVDSLFVEFDDRELAAREREGSGEVVAEPEAEPLESSEPRHQKRPSDQRPSDDVIASKKARTLHHFSVVNITVHLPENDSHPELLHLLAEIGKKRNLKWSSRSPSIESLLEHLSNRNEITVSVLIADDLYAEWKPTGIESQRTLDNGDGEHIPESCVAEVERSKDGLIVIHGCAWPTWEEQDTVGAE